LWSCETWNHKYTARLAVGATIAATILFVVVAITLPTAIAKHRESIKLKKEAESETKFSNFLSEKAIKTDKEKDDEIESMTKEINAGIGKGKSDRILTKAQISINKNEDVNSYADPGEVNIDEDLVRTTLKKISKDGKIGSLPALVKSFRTQIERQKGGLNESEPIYLQVAKNYIDDYNRKIKARLGDLESATSSRELLNVSLTICPTKEQNVWNEIIIMVRTYIFCKEIKDYFEKL
jgi:hypothetical protein